MMASGAVSITSNSFCVLWSCSIRMNSMGRNITGITAMIDAEPLALSPTAPPTSMR